MSNQTPATPARRLAILSAAIGVPVVGLALGAIALVPMLTGTSTSVSGTGLDGPLGITAFDTLSVQPEEQLIFEDAVWVVPVDADWAAFPTEPAGPDEFLACTDAQRAWLEAEGDYAPVATTYEFANTATSGSNLSIFDVRLDGEFAAPDPSIEVHCRSLGGGQGGVEMVISSLGQSTSAPAVVEGVESIEGADVSYVVGEQVVFNLRPGDQSILWLSWNDRPDGQEFRGDLVATISSGDREAEVALPAQYGHFSLPVASMAESYIAINQGILFCHDGGADPAGFAQIVGQIDGCDSTPGIAGTWSGDVLGDRNPYSLDVTVTEIGGVFSAVASYPEIPCTATWREVGRTTTTVDFVETVDAGSRCFDQVPVTVQIVDGGTGGLQLSYSALSGGYALTADLFR